MRYVLYFGLLAVAIAFDGLMLYLFFKMRRRLNNRDTSWDVYKGGPPA